MKKKLRIKKRAWIAMSILLLILLFTGIWFASNEVVRTVKPEFHVISTEFSVEAILIRDEKIIRSPNMGHISFDGLSEGERIRVNQQIATVTNQTLEGINNQIEIIADSAGIVSFYTDGFEEFLRDRQIGDIDLIEIKNRDFDQYRGRRNDGDLIAGGTPILRIINPFSDVNFILFFPKEYVIRQGFELSELRENSIILKNDMNEYRVSITDVGFSEESIFCFGRVINPGEDFHNVRRESFTLVLDRLAGYLISEEAIVYVEGEPGVYIQTRTLTRSSYNWVSVEILERVSDKVLLTREISGHSVVINPQVL